MLYQLYSAIATDAKSPRKCATTRWQCSCTKVISVFSIRSICAAEWSKRSRSMRLIWTLVRGFNTIKRRCFPV